MEIEQLVKFAADPTTPVCPEEKWSFYNLENPNGGIASLHQAFMQLRIGLPQAATSFLDCGSGNGIAAEVALLANFNPVYGIEINSSLNLLAKKGSANLSRQQIIEKNSIHFAHGSYYRQDSLPDIVVRCQQALQLMYLNEGLGNSLDFVQYVAAILGKHNNSSTEALIAGYLQSKNGDPFSKLGIISGKTLTVDVVYIYPSDIFFECAFLPQMGILMKKSSHLVVLTPVDDCLATPSPGFCQKKPILLPEYSDTPMCLQVFQRV